MLTVGTLAINGPQAFLPWCQLCSAEDTFDNLYLKDFLTEKLTCFKWHNKYQFESQVTNLNLIKNSFFIEQCKIPLKSQFDNLSTNVVEFYCLVIQKMRSWHPGSDYN